MELIGGVFVHLKAPIAVMGVLDPILMGSVLGINTQINSNY